MPGALDALQQLGVSAHQAAIATINAFNRVNTATGQITGDYVARIVTQAAG